MRAIIMKKMDPLIRIQEEIKEVVRREQEHRQLTSSVSMNGLNDDDFTENDDTNNNNNSLKSSSLSTDNSLTINDPDSHELQKAVLATVVATALRVHDDTPSLASSVNSKDSCDEQHHSDDSGISASSSPINGISANKAKEEYAKACATTTTTTTTPSTPLGGSRENRYIGPNCYNLTPEPPQQKLMTRTVSTPHLAMNKPRQFAFSPAHKGVMQRFIASRGKLQLSPSSPGAAAGPLLSTANPIMLNGKHAAALLNGGVSPGTASPGSEFTPFAGQNAAAIERDAEGRPIRPGYVPVELKIQRELKDLKSRESELKKIRKIRQSTPDLLDSIDNENIETDSEDSEVEHCYGPGKLRTAKSISELCDTAQAFNTVSPRITPSPDFDGKCQSAANRGNATQSNGLRPAVSLAQLCDLDPQEAPSSHRLIAQWENIIQQNA